MGTSIVHDFSILGLFMQADPVVKGVIVVLVVASVACWAIVLDKFVGFARARRDLLRLENAIGADAFVSGRASEGGIGNAVLAAGMREYRDGREAGESRAEYRDRIERAMRAALAIELRRLEPGLPFL